MHRKKVNEDDDINFRKLLYLWTVELGQSEKSFWRKTLRQIFVLLDEHRKVNEPEEEKTLYADEIVW